MLRLLFNPPQRWRTSENVTLHVNVGGGLAREAVSFARGAKTCSG